MKVNNILSDVSNKVNAYINHKKANIDRLDKAINSSSRFTLDKDVTVNNDNLVNCNPYEYKDMCVYIKYDYAVLIDGIIPIDETVISIVNAIEKVSHEDYIMVFTDKRIIVMNKEKYTDFGYDKVANFSLVSKGFMTQVVCFNNVILDMNLIYEDLIITYNLVTNQKFRENLINEKKKYLCGITPIYQKINKIKSGISIDKDKNIVFHDQKKEIYLCNYDDIINYEIMEDNNVALKKWTREQSQAIGFTKKECYKMSIRVTLKDGKSFEIMLLEPSTFNNAYHHSDKSYLEHINFAKEIMDKLETYNEEKRNFS